MKLEAYSFDPEEVVVLRPRTEEAKIAARTELKALIADRGTRGSTLKGLKKKRGRNDMDAEEG